MADPVTLIRGNGLGKRAGQLGDGGDHPAVDERGHRCRGLRWVKEMLALNVAVDDADG